MSETEGRAVSVHFAWNNPNGAFSGHVEAVEFEDATGEMVLSLTLDESTPVSRTVGEIELHGERFETRGRREHVGNMLWDCCGMAEADAVRLARLLLRHNWSADEWIPETPIGGLVYDTEPRHD